MPNRAFVLRFDDIEVREREFSITKAGVAQPIGPEAFACLAAGP